MPHRQEMSSTPLFLEVKYRGEIYLLHKTEYSSTNNKALYLTPVRGDKDNIMCTVNTDEILMGGEIAISNCDEFQLYLSLLFSKVVSEIKRKIKLSDCHEALVCDYLL